MTLGRAAPLSLALYTLVYVVAGALSFSSAYLLPNAATVWVPSGLALGLLLNKGRHYWPSIFLGAWLLNTGVLMRSAPSFQPSIAIAALAIAAGNTVEALLSAELTKRFANGRSYPFRTRNVLTFIVLCAPVPPLISAAIGAGAALLCGLPGNSDPGQAALLWYIANTQSLVLFGSMMVLLPDALSDGPDVGKVLEGVGLLLLLCVAVLLIGGVVNIEWLQSWPRTSMLIPFVVWASFRFGSIGGLICVFAITVAAAAETINGYAVFPGETPWRSLMYLQVYLAMLSLIALTIGAALAERDELAANLENRINARTSTLRSILDHNRFSVALAAHDLKGPALELRQAFANFRKQAETGGATSQAALETLAESEATCTRLLGQISKLLTVDEVEQKTEQQSKASLEDIVLASFAAHRVSARAKNIDLDVEAERDFEISAATEVEQILNTLIENAIRHAPSGSRVCIKAKEHDGRIKIFVRDEGAGISPNQVDGLFQPPAASLASRELYATGRSGLGLFLARKQAEWIGGTLNYMPTASSGATFVLEVHGEPSASGQSVG